MLHEYSTGHTKQSSSRNEGVGGYLTLFKKCRNKECRKLIPSHGTHYFMKFPDGKSREICEDCWRLNNFEDEMPIEARIQMPSDEDIDTYNKLARSGKNYRREDLPFRVGGRKVNL